MRNFFISMAYYNFRVIEGGVLPWMIFLSVMSLLFLGGFNREGIFVLPMFCWFVFFVLLIPGLIMRLKFGAAHYETYKEALITREELKKTKKEEQQKAIEEAKNQPDPVGDFIEGIFGCVFVLALICAFGYGCLLLIREFFRFVLH